MKPPATDTRTLSEKRRDAAHKSAASRRLKAKADPRCYIYVRASDAERLRTMSDATGETAIETLTRALDACAALDMHRTPGQKFTRTSPNTTRKATP